MNASRPVPSAGAVARRLPPLRRLAALAAALTLAACGGGGSAGNPDPAPTPCASGTCSVDASGGSVSVANGPALTFPPAAIGTATHVTITEAAPAPAGALTPVFEFGPSGATFAQPVTIRFTVPAGTEAASIYWTVPGSTTAFEALATTVTGTTATAQVTHFSRGYVGESCSPGAACVPANTCHVGRTTCEGARACVDTATNVADGTTCPAGVCSAGACGPAVGLPDVPAGVAGRPGDRAVTVSWTAASRAASYRVYHAAMMDVTSASSVVTTATPEAAVSGLVNGTVRYFAVSAVNAAGESALSPVVCAVPTASGTAGLRLHDGLCAGPLDAARWPGQTSSEATVAGGKARLTVQVANQESRRLRGTNYSVARSVAAGGRRVTTLAGTVAVPAASASRSGSAQIRAALRLSYQPPALRAAGNQDYLDFTVGLIEKGSGLQIFRQASHCDAAICADSYADGIAFVDPPELTTVAAVQASAPAAYDTPYAVTLTVDEAARVLRWTIAGGAYGAGISGTADVSQYLAAAAGWTGDTLATAFSSAQLQVRTQDTSTAGGGSGAITGVFDDVQVGFDGAAAAPFDDFGGTGGNSGAWGFAPQKWSPQGTRVQLINQGSLLSQAFVETVGTTAAVSSYHGLSLPDPGSIATFQADTWIPSFVTTTGVTASRTTYLQGRYYQTGTSDVSAQLMMSETGVVWFSVGRCTNASCSGQVNAGAAQLGQVSPAQPHALRIGWNETSRTLTFGLDGTNVTIDPQVASTIISQALPYAGPASSPQRTIFTGVSVPAGAAEAAGLVAGVNVRVNNVFVGP